MKKLLVVLIIFAILPLNLLAGSKKPRWVKKRPNSKIDYIGIAMASKRVHPEDYATFAQKQALRNLAEQIQIRIEGTEVQKIMETNDDLVSSYESFLKSSIVNDLEDYEMVDTWENKDEYWVFYKLNKETYWKKRREKIRQAVAIATDFYQKGIDYIKGLNYHGALSSYLQALKAVEKYSNEPLTTVIGTEKVYIINEIIKALNDAVQDISLTPLAKELDLKIGSQELPAVKVKAFQKGNMKTLTEVPILYQGGSVLFTDSLVPTNISGYARFTVKSFDPATQSGMLKFVLDPRTVIADTTISPFVQSVLKSLPERSCTVPYNITGLTAYFDIQEYNLGHKTSLDHISPAFKNFLTQFGFTFTEDKTQADWIIKVKANTIQGTQIHSLYTAFADVEISIFSQRLNKEIYNNTINHLKGIQLGYRQAGLKALENAAKKSVEGLGPEIEKLISQ